MLAVATPALLSAQAGPGAGVGPRGLPATGPPATAEYAVTFVESGLANGTSWNVTIASVVVKSTTTSIVFQEPDGTYLFLVGSVPGYTSNPEGNVTVSGGPVSVPILFTSNSTGTPGCTGYSWDGGNYTLHGDCLGSFQTDLRSYSATSGNTFENSTFDVAAIAEVNGAGDLAALLLPNHESTGAMSAVVEPSEVNVTDSIEANVTTAVGLNASTGAPDGEVPVWAPNEAPGSVGPTIWGNGSEVLGSVEVVIVLHFVVGPPATNRVKFDVSISGWPWVSSSDTLGIVIGATAAQGTSFAYSASNDTISELWSSNGTIASSLVFGASANATAGSAISTLEVSDQVGLYPIGTTPSIAQALLSFHGPGGYSALAYDPWIVFGPPSTISVPPTLPVATGGATLPLIAAGAIALATALLGVTAYRLRRGRVDQGLRSIS